MLKSRLYLSNDIVKKENRVGKLWIAFVLCEWWLNNKAAVRAMRQRATVSINFYLTVLLSQHYYKPTLLYKNASNSEKKHLKLNHIRLVQ